MKNDEFPYKPFQFILGVIFGKQKPPEAAGDKSLAFGHQKTMENSERHKKL